jgi:hypothetical protein
VFGAAMIAAAGWMFERTAVAQGRPEKADVLFEGKTLDGWIQVGTVPLSVAQTASTEPVTVR